MAFDPLAIFTGAPIQNAAEQQRQYLAGISGNINNIYDTARTGGLAALQSGQNQGVDALTAGILQGRGDIAGSINPAIASLYGGTTQAANALNAGQLGGLASLQSGVTSAVGGYDPLAAAAGRYGAAGTAASNMSADALGINGPEGIDRATAAFRSSPGYNFSVGQGIDALTRAAAAGGQAAGGNVLQGAQKFGQGLADQDFQTWLNNVTNRGNINQAAEAQALGNVASGTANAYLTGGTGGANIYTGTGGKLADLYSSGGKAASDIYGTAGRGLSALAAGGGQNLADLFSKTGQSTADLYRMLAGGQAGAESDIAKLTAPSWMDAAKAEVGGSQNLWNALGGALTFGAGGGLNPASWGQSFRPTPARA